MLGGGGTAPAWHRAVANGGCQGDDRSAEERQGLYEPMWRSAQSPRVHFQRQLWGDMLMSHTPRQSRLLPVSKPLYPSDMPLEVTDSINSTVIIKCSGYKGRTTEKSTTKVKSFNSSDTLEREQLADSQEMMLGLLRAWVVLR